MNLLREPVRFGAVGIVNTLVGVAAIVAFMWLGADPVPANAMGYAVGLGCSFVLNRRWTFASQGPVSRELPRYLAVMAIAYLLNIAAVGTLTQHQAANAYVAQVVGMGLYTCCTFLGLRWLVFAPSRAAGIDRALAPRAHTPADAGASSRLPELAMALGFVGAVALLRDVAVGHDAVWQLWIARQIVHGAHLYTDIVEVNPPLWFWMAVPLVQVSELTGIAPRECLRLAFFGAFALSLWLAMRLRRGQQEVERWALYGGMLAAGTLVVLPDFGQREHYVLLASLPYVALIATRAQRGPAPAPWLAAAVGVFAASGFALKIHFALAPLALEAWLWLRLRGRWTPWRAEMIALAGCAAAYGACVFAFSPDYLRNVVPILFASYTAFGKPPVFLAMQVVVFLSLLSAVALVSYRGPRTTMGGASLVAALAFVVAFLAQQKGWRYHTVPALGTLFVFAAAECTALRWRSARRDRPGALALASVMLLTVFEALHTGPYRNDNYATAQSALSGFERGDSVMMLAINPSTIWPMVEDRELVWPSRYMSLWMVPAIARARHEGRTSAELEALATAVRRQTLEDLQCHPPRRILVDDPVLSLGMPEAEFSYLGFLKEEPGLREFLERYRAGATFGRFATYDLADPGGIEPGRRCRAVF